MEKVNPLRRRVGEGHLVGLWIVGRENFSEESDQVKQNDNDAPNDRHLVLDETPPHHLQRGSNIDAVLFLIIVKIGEIIVGILGPQMDIPRLCQRAMRRISAPDS